MAHPIQATHAIIPAHSSFRRLPTFLQVPSLWGPRLFRPGMALGRHHARDGGTFDWSGSRISVVVNLFRLDAYQHTCTPATLGRVPPAFIIIHAPTAMFRNVIEA
jgi:hypothetical protein